ncbi:MAG: peptidase E [Mesoflavibacter sp.]|nr:peptidase E [Mesoflavibacter sp.]
MKSIKLISVIAIFFLCSFNTLHKYYVSITQIEFVKEQQSVQIISRIFIDDFESVLRKGYDKNITLDRGDDETQIDDYIKKYLLTKIEISINNQEVIPNFIGKKYDDGIMHCYLEIENIKSISTFQIKNKVLFDMFEDQKNVIRTNINNKNKTVVLTAQNDKGLLNF